jgi:molybdopterin-biosynthesis enzyme MoeA-like protein
MYLHFTPFTVERSCGEVTRQNCSYFVNPGFPAPVMEMLACILTVEKAHPDVSQIRLDFYTFEVSFDKMIMIDKEDSTQTRNVAQE